MGAAVISDGFSIHPLTAIHPSNPEWTIYGSSKSSQSVYAQPKCIPYPLFVVIKINTSRIWTRGKELNLEFWMQVLQILTQWSKSIPNFEEVYASLPFNASIIKFRSYQWPGSIIYATEQILMVPIDTNETSVMNNLVKATLKPDWTFENQLRTFVTLRNFWGIKMDSFEGSSVTSDAGCQKMPPTIPVMSLLLKAWLHDTVTLVSIPHSKDPKALYAFKTNKSAYCLYQELHSLLNMPSHPNVLQHPSYLVTKDTLHSIHNPLDSASPYFCERTEPIIGFLTPYYAGGKLSDIIPSRVAAKTLSKIDQARWARQLTSALLHVFKYENCSNKARCGVHTSLKMDNIILTSLEEGSNLVLIDFEKGANWLYYSPPEVKLCSQYNTGQQSGYRSSILKRQNSAYDYVGPGKCVYKEDFWDHASDHEREAAMVYSLGCCLWCILEGNGCVREVRYQCSDSLGARWPSANRCPWDPDKAEKYGIPETVKDIVTRMLRKNPGHRPTLQEVSDILGLWESSLGGIEVEFVGEGGTEMQEREVVSIPSLSTEAEHTITIIDWPEPKILCTPELP